MARKKEMYSIGQFAEMSNTTIKQLRYLDEKGILKPNVRNKETHYRYYTQEQLERLVLIKALRSLGIAFEEVVRVMGSEDPEDLVNILKGHLVETEQAVNRAIQLFERNTSYYMQLLKGNAMIAQHTGPDGGQRVPEGFQVVDVPRQSVLYTRYKSIITAQELFIERFAELQRLCDSACILPGEGMVAVFHDHCLNQFTGHSEDVETLFPLKYAVGPAGNIRHFGGFRAVCAIHIGHYKDMKPLYLRMFAWARENDVAVMEQSVEQYILGPDMTNDPKKYVTQVLLPLAGSRL